jgi:NADPH:quinone reductase-like Zn-dependent oxidoreductase
LRFVGWPIVPGFDFSGSVAWAGADTGFKEGDEVFGFTLFGAYSSSILVPGSQIRRKPKKLSLETASALPAVSATALHACALAGGYPGPLLSTNKAALIHSAAGGVGSMLIQMCKQLGYSPVVAVVGSSHKVAFCKELGADHVIDKSSCDLWVEAKKISSAGYVAIFDANGVSTLNDSYGHLCKTGRLIVYGFHSNLPKVSDFLSPLAWVSMILKVFQMPKFDAMDMTVDSKGVLGFNLSFFADEKALIEKYLTQIIEWVDNGNLKVAAVKVFPMTSIGQAHELIQSGSSVGKIVCKVQVDKSNDAKSM